ncbi:MAG: P-loop NTPase [Candidatus Micrarchaeia archaeon]
MDEKPAQKIDPSFKIVMDQKARLKEKLSSIKNKIGVYSAKGGVGKTTVAVNLAYVLKNKGYRVGLLDADIDCPNISIFLGIENTKIKPIAPLVPVDKDGIKVISTAMLTDDEEKPIIWRGPLITKMLGEMLEYTDFGELDYLIIDLPPGTSDAPLSIMQLLDMNGFIIVTTPQKVSYINSLRSGLMAKKLNSNVLGIIENMSESGRSKYTEQLAQALNSEVIGNISRSPLFNEYSDNGKIPVIENKDIYNEFENIANSIIESLKV